MSASLPAGPSFIDILTATAAASHPRTAFATPDPAPVVATADAADRKAVAVAVLKGVFERGDADVVDQYLSPGLIQHSPFIADGVQALKDLARTVTDRFPELEYRVQRVLAQGDLVLVHSHVIATPGARGAAVVDTFRFEDGLIVEQWQVSQEVPEVTANPNGMFSTVSEPQTNEPGPAWQTLASQLLVTEVFQRVLAGQDPSAIDALYGPVLYQHNPFIPDGLEAAKKWLGDYFSSLPDLAISQPKRVIAEGDVVAIHSHGINAPGEAGIAVVDLFRVRDGRVVEHWDVLQPIPETSANNNPMI